MRCSKRFLFIYLVSLYSLLGWAGEVDLQSRIDAAVLHARQGEFKAAIAQMEKIRNQYPERQEVLQDLVVVYHWAGRYQEAAALIPLLEMDNAPNYTLEAVARVLRSTGKVSEAILVYRRLLARLPDSKQALLGLVLSYADAGEFNKAERLLADHANNHGDDLDYMSAQAYVVRKSGRALRALAMYQSILSRDPGHREAAEGVFLCAQSLGAFPAAKDIAERSPSILDRRQLDSLYQGLAATHIRWGETASLKQEERFQDIDRALRLLEQLKGDDEWNRLDFAVSLNRRLAFDGLVALQARKRHQEVVELFQALSDADVNIPAYALLSVATAYLDLEQPDTAFGLLVNAKDQGEDSFQLTGGLFYSLSDDERFADAQQLIDEVAKREPEFIPEFTNREFILNEKKLKADMLSAFIRAYADDLDSAQDKVERVLERAPHNHDIRADLGTLFRWRGWPERATDQFDLATSYMEAGEATNARVQLGHALIDRQIAGDAGSLVEQLTTAFPEEKSVQKLARRWLVYNEHELLMRFSRGESSGNQFGTRNWQLDTYLYNQRFGAGAGWAEGSRLYVHDYQAFADLETGDIRNELTTLGYEWVHDRVKVNAELGKGISGSDGVVASASVRWWLDDHWRLAGELQHNSRATPLKALREDIESDTADFSAQYRWSELQSAGVSAGIADFDDGNERNSLATFLKRRVHNSPGYKITAEVGASVSSNSLLNRPYFNPDQDRTVYLQMENEWRWYRRYERSFHHRLYLTLGNYWQKQFGAGSIWSWRYEHDWELGPRLRVLYGISRGRRLYDGNTEFEDFIYGTLNWHF